MHLLRKVFFLVNYFVEFQETQIQRYMYVVEPIGNARISKDRISFVSSTYDVIFHNIYTKQEKQWQFKIGMFPWNKVSIQIRTARQSFLLNWAWLFAFHNFLNYRDFVYICTRKVDLFVCQRLDSSIFLQCIRWFFAFGIYAMITQSKFGITTNYMCRTEKLDRFSVKWNNFLFVVYRMKFPTSRLFLHIFVSMTKEKVFKLLQQIFSTCMR